MRGVADVGWKFLHPMNPPASTLHRWLVRTAACGCCWLSLGTSASAAAAPDASHEAAAWASHWPAGQSPAEIGVRVAETILPRKFRFETDAKRVREGIIYPEVLAWRAALRVASLTRSEALRLALVRKLDRFLAGPDATFVNPSAHVDYRVFGVLPLEVFQQNQDPRCKSLGLKLADAQWETTSPDGITTEARYWIDDMYMIPALQAQAFRVTRNTIYLDRAALTMSAYLDRLQQANGLFFHGENAAFFWGRGNGWMAAGAADLLSVLPEHHPQRARILAGYRSMMAALLQCQRSDGLWGQLIDRPDSWAETSGSAMFTYAMILGSKRGWLDPAHYGPAARKAWLALAGRLDEHAQLRDVCVGTNKGFDLAYYLDRPRAAGDLHGQTPMLWCVEAWLE